MLIIISLVILTFIVCFAISHVFLSIFLYEEKRVFKNYKTDIFSFIFGISNILMILIVLEIAEIDEFE